MPKWTPEQIRQTKAGKAFLEGEATHRMAPPTPQNAPETILTAPKVTTPQPRQPKRPKGKGGGGTKYSTDVVLAYFKESGLPLPFVEFRFHPERLFRFDFCWADKKVALEVEGGIYTRQAHGSISGILRDMEKQNLSASLGFRVLRVTPDNLCMNETVELVKKTLSA
jgi:hypothetical protein